MSQLFELTQFLIHLAKEAILDKIKSGKHLRPIQFTSVIVVISVYKLNNLLKI